MRGTVLAAVAVTTALTLAGCAKDSGAPSGGGNASGSECKLAPKPPAAVASTTAAKTPEKADGSALKVGLAFDIGGRGDASFNDSAAAGVDKAVAELGVKKENVKELSAGPNEAESAKQTRIRQLASDGVNPIIAVGFAYADALKAVAPSFPNTKFAIVDATVEGATNVTPLVFAEEQGSFLTGVIAAYKSKKCNVGFVGGVETPLIQKFEAGYYQGAKAAAPDIKIAKKYLTPAGDFTGFQDPAKGNAAAQGLVSGGSDVLYHAAGASGKGVFTAAKTAGVSAIGVDSDQYNQKTVEQERDVIISSMLKRVDVAVFDYLLAVAKNDLTKLPKVFDFSVGGVGYSTSGGKIDADLQAVLEGYKAQIVSGQIKVSDKPTS
ncbi:BMP family ABC transporter substrate-binding protein [Allokutzneria sp. A3M-2-11 16]|uniref:BMP family lipoprotein n=1 Tax=Allokutzneria sp. A3M-2-11 16 TaxID=2962043 RepID=UPI0020B823D3|nr:BMP family ABC transporter substrate-binding protein [Allokutzneria sp. A3M-2-11 16]MCP3800389.1 BMP family ABC transporter substrate-binding protein [Allokutzneria sp. A3M-2-11 16]